VKGDVQDETGERRENVVATPDKRPSGEVGTDIDSDFTNFVGEKGGEKTFPHVVSRGSTDFNPVRVVICAGDVDTSKPRFLDEKDVV
jgi:hypothetical protein